MRLAVRRGLAAVCVWLLAMGLAPGAFAHEVRPAYLEISQPNASTYKIVWKQPTLGEVALHLVPHLSNGWLEQPPTDQFAAGGFLIRTWIVKPNASESLAGSTLSIEGLEQSITDVLVRIRPWNGEEVNAVIRPVNPRMPIAVGQTETVTLPAFLLLGIEHILTGWDHLLFVLGLLLIVRDRWMLLKTVTAFTLAHSITLGLAVLGKVTLPSALVEALISLSIFFLAPEILRARRGGTSLTIRYPWAVAFGFGLFHGMGFAGALGPLGFEGVELLSALLLFNVGVELGQLAFIAVILLLGRAMLALNVDRTRRTAVAAAYGIGIAGTVLTLRCSATLLGFL